VARALDVTSLSWCWAIAKLGSGVTLPLCFPGAFGCSHYLGLATKPRLREAAIATIWKNALAKWKGTPAALCFSSGYAAAVGTLQALLTKNDVVCSTAQPRLVHRQREVESRYHSCFSAQPFGQTGESHRMYELPRPRCTMMRRSKRLLTR
jgi:hypothetical protein